MDQRVRGGSSMLDQVRHWRAALGSIGLCVLLGIFTVAQGAPPAKAAFAFGLAILLVVAIAALQGRSETAAVLSGNPVDERQRMIHLRAIEFAGAVTVAVSVGGYVVVETMQGDSTGFAVIAMSFGLAYASAVFWLRNRV